MFGFVGNDGINKWDLLGFIEDSTWSYRDAYEKAHEYVRNSGKKSLDRGWKDLEQYTKININNYSDFPENFRKMLNASRTGAGWLVELGVGRQSPSGNLGIYRLDHKRFRNGLNIYDWAFIMGVETSAIIYCRIDNSKEIFGYITDEGSLPTLQDMRGTDGLIGRVSDAVIGKMIGEIPGNGKPLHFVHSHLVDRLDVSTVSTGADQAYVGLSGGLSDLDRAYFVGTRFQGKIGIGAVEDNGKTHSIQRNRGGSEAWEDL